MDTGWLPWAGGSSITKTISFPGDGIIDSVVKKRLIKVHLYGGILDFASGFG
jgi:hypothetical protein